MQYSYQAFLFSYLYDNFVSIKHSVLTKEYDLGIFQFKLYFFNLAYIRDLDTPDIVHAFSTL